MSIFEEGREPEGNFLKRNAYAERVMS